MVRSRGRNQAHERNAAAGEGIFAAVRVRAIPLAVLASYAFTNQQGIQTQGRHLLPLLVIVTLLAGEVVQRRLSQTSLSWTLAVSLVISSAATLWAVLVAGTVAGVVLATATSIRTAPGLRSQGAPSPA
jgi:cell division protein FtsW (lipid II flippase)